jgi:glycosyltransferase involved in cell wall biosynthesis
MRILHLVGGLNRGGAETWLVQMLHHLDRQKYQLDFLVHSVDPGAYDEAVKALGARVIPCLKPSNPLQYAYNFRRILRKYGPYDCVHSHVHQFSGYVLLLAFLMRVPVRIVHCHSDTRAVDCKSSLVRKAYLSAMRALISQFATRGVAVSEFAATSLFSASWRSDARWSLLSLGIDLSPFRPQMDRKQIRSELEIPEDASVVGHVGRFCEVKNHRFLVEFAARLCDLEPKAVFLLVGDGPLRPEIEDLVRARGLQKHFIFAGIRADVPRLMKGAMDCFVLPSFYEGLPLVLLEAQAAGLHCVVSDAVSGEGDLGEIAVTRLAVDRSPDHWATQLRIALSKRNEFPVSQDWIQARSIETSAASIESLYSSAVIGRRTLVRKETYPHAVSGHP